MRLADAAYLAGFSTVPFNEFKEGLETLGVLHAIQQHPEKFIDVFCKSNMPVLDAKMVDLIFFPMFDEEGTNRRPLQEQTIVYWRDYLQDCEGTCDTIPPKRA